ncbi:MAG: YihY/virulence factor BrkB family protein [Chitinophagaceae bacterium]|nr:MAG: YihY/virulence factor BrkB family protein [Chitinophagaceae bacterium]
MQQLLTHIKRAILVSLPFRFLIRRSKKITLPGFEGISIFEVVTFFFNQVKKTSLNERAASIAFNMLMAIPPACIFLFTLIPFLPVDGFMNQLYDLIRNVVPEEKVNSPLIAFLNNFTTQQRNELLSFGLLLALFFSSNAMMGILRSFDKDYEGFSKRTALHDRWVAIKLTLIFYLIIILSIFALLTGTVVLEWLGIRSSFLKSFIINARWLVILLLYFFSISFIYRHAPAVQKKWKLINPGSILSTFIMIIFTLLFTWWTVEFGNYNKLYGSIGTVLIFMLLIFFNSLVLLIGFELNVSIASLQKTSSSNKN